jgi:hypothetical protein
MGSALLPLVRRRNSHEPQYQSAPSLSCLQRKVWDAASTVVRFILEAR